ncbi:dTDP-4-dehydrorhamnose reductase [Thalassospira alkalitolerans]|uniref:dTDP-4-dehydrorhamnose reductase n=1 Tax=Thalassospira alkalitolerans TaxID=1293890 RepID=UPI003AA8F3A1
MIKALVFGGNGQLGRSLMLCVRDFPDIELTFLDRRKCDLSDLGAIGRAILDCRPDIVINAAAYTAVDQAESDIEQAFLINRDAVRAMAQACEELNAPLIHFSTDYVFDGASQHPYRENDPVAPLGVYGASKLAGEDAVRAATARHLIFRTSWVYSPFGKNFVKTMLSLMVQRDVLTIVNDQTGCPTSSVDLAGAVLRLVPSVLGKTFAGFGTYHLVSGSPMTWFDFAVHIHRAAVERFRADWAGNECEIRPVSSDAFPTVAKRPGYSVMSSQKFTDTFGFGLPDLAESLGACLDQLGEGENNA